MGGMKVVPFLEVRDMKRSLAFYVDGLGFEMTDEWRVDGEIRWCQLDLDGASLMLQEYRGERRRAEGVKPPEMFLCVFCDDAVDLYRQLKARSLEPDEPYVGNSLWVTSIEDPDRHRLDFESPTDVPEETKLSQYEAAREG